MVNRILTVLFVVLAINAVPSAHAADPIVTESTTDSTVTTRGCVDLTNPPAIRLRTSK